MAAPTWLAATAGYVSLPGQINQFLTTHTSVWTYSGSTLQSSQATGSSVYTSTDALYLAQLFTTGSSQTAIGQVLLQISTVGGSPITATISPLVVSLYASSAGQPTGSALVSTTLTEQYVYSAPFWMPVPLPITGLTASTPYHIVVSPAGTSTAYYVWQQSNQVGGANTAPDGVTWTSQAYGLMYQVYDQTGTLWPPISLVDDGGVRVTSFTYNGTSQLTGITESVVTQSGGSFYSTRAIAYSGQYPTGVS